MIEPLIMDQAFLADMAAANAMNDEFRPWWLGQSRFLIQFRGRHHLLLDPLCVVRTGSGAGTSVV